MSGMTTTGSTSVSNRDTRTILVEVTGLCRQNVSKTSNYHLKVPYNRLSQTIQNISRMGGKVSKVDVLSGGAETSINTETSTKSEVREVKKEVNREREVKKESSPVQPQENQPQAKRKRGFFP
jgi:phycocyanin-associated, rod